MLNIDLKGKKVFVAGIGDDKGFGWAIAKAMAEAGAEILVGTWTPMMNIFTTALKRGKFDESRKLSDGSMLEFAKVYPLDAVYDTPEDVPEDVKGSKRYVGFEGYTVKEVAEQVEKDFGKIDILVHSLANGSEVGRPLLETSRQGYLQAISASAFSLISLISHFGPILNEGGSVLSISYMASEKAVPGYGGGMSSAKAALESDTRTLAFEAGRKWGLRVNTVSAGAWGSRAARAIGFVDRMMAYSEANSPLQKNIKPSDVGQTAAFLCSSMGASITGTTVYVDNGMHIMGVAVDSPTLSPSN